MVNLLFPALGAAAIYLFVRWRDSRDLAVSAETKPAEPGAFPSAPFATGGISSDEMFVSQHPGVLDEFGPDAVSMTGELVPAAARVQPTRYTPAVDDSNDLYYYRDETSAAPVATLELEYVDEPTYIEPTLVEGRPVHQTITPSVKIGDKTKDPGKREPKKPQPKKPDIKKRAEPKRAQRSEPKLAAPKKDGKRKR